MTAQLIDATTGLHLWAERYDRILDDIFAIQDEITREIVVALVSNCAMASSPECWRAAPRILMIGNVSDWDGTF